MQFTSSRYGDDEYWKNHQNLIKNLKQLSKDRYRAMTLEFLSKNYLQFSWKNSFIEVSLESKNLLHMSVKVAKDGRGIGGSSRFIFQGLTKKRWITNFFAQLEAGLEEVFVDFTPHIMTENEIVEESQYLSKIFALEEQKIDFYSSLARELKRKYKLSIEYEDAVIEYKLGLVGCSYSIIYQEEIGESTSGYLRLGWRRREKLCGMPFIFARHEVEYGPRA